MAGIICKREVGIKNIWSQSTMTAVPTQLNSPDYNWTDNNWTGNYCTDNDCTDND